MTAKRGLFRLGLLAAAAGAAALFGQNLQHVVSVVNIEIPVRVTKGDVFADQLALGDFEVRDDGVLQAIEAVYLVKKTDIRRREGKTGVPPQVNRQFVLFFEMADYQPEIDEALDLFFGKVFLPGDSLIVVTPMGNFHLRGDALGRVSKDAIQSRLRARLRKDITMGSRAYKTTIDDMFRTLATMQAGSKDDSVSLEQLLDDYTTDLSRLESLRRVDEKGLIDFARFLKDLPGQKFVYMFYQTERIPQYNAKNLMMKTMENQDKIQLLTKFTEAFDSFHRDVGFDVETVKRAYADSGITIHFLYVNKTPAVQYPVEVRLDADKAPLDIAMVEKSEDIYAAFSQIARATGGLTDSSADASASFGRAVEASDNYYLIYYKPVDYKADGKFHELKVSVKGGGYRVMHRAGYIAK